MSIGVVAADAEPRLKPSNYPSPFAERMAGRVKRVLGDPAGLTGFGVNLTTLAPGAASSLLHRHAVQDEFVYILRGQATLVTDSGEETLSPGMCAAFKAGGVAHQLVNRSDEPVTYLEVGDRRPNDSADYPADDLVATFEAGAWLFTHKDGSPY